MIAYKKASPAREWHFRGIIHLLKKNDKRSKEICAVVLPLTYKAMTEFYSQHTKFYVSVDCIILGFEGNQLQVLIGKRKMEPGCGEWSLYGGFVKGDESLDDAARRVVHDLTGMNDVYMHQVGAYGAIDRDPGDRVISVAYYTLINVKDYDDKLREKYGVEWVKLEELPDLYSDHKSMIMDALEHIRCNIKTQPLSFHLLPELFTLTQLQHVYEAILGKELDKRNFRKSVKQVDLIQPTDKIDHTMSRSGARLYRFNQEKYEEDPTFKL